MARTWEEAKKRCKLEGATLFYPEDQYEVESITAYWNITHGFNTIYIGVSDLVANEVYRTVDGELNLKLVVIILCAYLIRVTMLRDTRITINYHRQ